MKPYDKMIEKIKELRRLIKEGKDDSSEAEAIRDETDIYWESFSEIEKQSIRDLAEKLYNE
jgi:hypothetical protein